MTIRQMNEADCVEVSELHRKEISSGFISSMGKDMLRLIYHAAIGSAVSFCMVAEDNDKIIGFALGTTDTGQFYREFIKKNLFRGGVLLVPKIINAGFIRRVVETLLYPAKRDKELPVAELLAIAVDDRHQREKLGEKLFAATKGEFKKRGVARFKVAAGSKLLSACRFYEKMGGFLHSEIELHRGERSRIYIWKIQ